MLGIHPGSVHRAAVMGAVVAALLIAATLPRTLGADAPPPQGIAFFEAKIRPVLAKRCYTCHGGPAQGKGGLKLDNKARLRTGGSSGSPIDLENPEESLLLAAIRYEGPSMPPSGKLPEETIADFAKWIKMGAPDPRDDSGPHSVLAAEIDFAAARKAWAYTAPRPAPRPRSATAVGPGDRSTASSWRDRRPPAFGPDLTPRRVCGSVASRFDLVGLPPTPEQVDGDLTRRLARGTRSRRRSLARLPRLRRALGQTLDGCRPVRRKFRQR